MKFELFFSGKSVHVSREARDFALVIDRLQKFPTLFKRLETLLQTVKKGVEDSEALEKQFGRAAVEAVIEKSFPK